MSDQYLRDRNGKQLGKIKQLSNGRLELRNPIGKLLGNYDPKSNLTRNANGRLVGKGNLLATLLA
jgi:hypothetical protein